ncbi:MAG: insulinase family protein [Spirochaetes bacterium]|nr:insulinase family protein [Spirochaetota bacterium]
MKKYVLDNGLTVILQPIETVVSISAGLWVKTGSRCEKPDQYGYAHFVEHMLFKGTEKYSAKDIAQMIDRVGGQHNAATNREYTCYYINVVSDYLRLSLEILSDMHLNSRFDAEDIEKERDVIIEELRMYEDSPDEHIHDVFMEIMFGEHPLAHEIIGTEKTLKAVTREKLVQFYKEQYIFENTLLVIAGNFKIDEAEKMISEFFRGKPGEKVLSKLYMPAQRKNFRQHINRELEQVHFCLGFDGITKNDERRWALYLLSSILGGSMSSRLFQNIREKEGLCYSVYSFHSSYSDAGLFGIYCGTSPSKYHFALDLIIKELQKLLKNNILPEELEDAKTFMKGNLALSLESIEVRASMAARDEINYKKQFTYDDVVKYIEAVKLEDFEELAGTLFKDKRASLVSIGKLKKSKKDNNIIISI